MIRFLGIGFILVSSWIVTGDYLEQNHHQGLFTHHLEEAHLIVPRRVNHLGEVISNNLTHHHEDITDNKLHYHIDFDNETMHIELEPSTHSFVAPLMVVERHKRDVRTRTKPQHHKRCHYQGHIRGHERSKVALSACNGIAGMMKTNKAEYWIEPSKNHQFSADKGHPHILFQRSAVKDKSLLRKKKKKKQKRKRHAMSNCGTKEPKRMVETRIEWQPQGKVIVQGGRKTRNMNHKKREKRSISTPRHVEALIVADSSMVDFHQDVDLEEYLLTIMNMVSSLYKDPTIGNSIQIVVVKIIMLEDDEAHQDFNVTHIAGSTLDNFCRWQRSLNPKTEDHPHHHDVAILVTRKNICSTHGCSTLGVANVGGMCRPDKSCSVNEDNGITLAHTISHELGHNFGMYHDTAKTGCIHRIGPILHIMTPSFEADTMQVSWSNCSRRDITHFLDLGLGKCLEDQPSQKLSYPDLPPGAMYNADLQCRMQFNSTDETISVCSKPDEICTQLWCLVDDVCTSLMRPAAPGTSCGRRKWCQEQQCQDIEELPTAIDGGWGNWSEWSNCSRLCGAGVARQTRECDHPSPAHGGTFCIGERARYKICSIEPCSDNVPSFRAEQCSAHNNETLKGQNVTWLPFFDKHEPCELYCTDSDETVILPFGDSAADGTPCNTGTNDMCIGGICRKVGCDWVVDSVTPEDQCGVCGGTGETCTTIKGEFTKKVNMTEGYYKITSIPAGSRQILIEENGPSKNFIGISKANSKEFYLNGDSFISMPGEFDIAKSIALYERDNEQEKLKIPGPIKEEIAVYVVFRGKNKHVGIRFEYTLSSNQSKDPIYYWKLAEWTACSVTCGGGIQYRVPVCHKRGSGVVDDKYCNKHADNKRHEKSLRVCNEDPCPAHWWVGPWQLCPVTCQKYGEPQPFRKRSLLCIDQNDTALPDSRCEIQARPVDTDPCTSKLPLCNNTEDDVSEVDEENDENNII